MNTGTIDFDEFVSMMSSLSTLFNDVSEPRPRQRIAGRAHGTEFCNSDEVLSCNQDWEQSTQATDS
eukprot:2286584-Rhodomonas_salina.2